MIKFGTGGWRAVIGSDFIERNICLVTEGICALMREEGKTEQGHLAHTLHLVADVENLHLQLLQLPIGADYRNVWAPLKEELPRLRIVLTRDGVSDIELCFRALYATILYRIKGDTDKQGAIEDVVALISPVIALLAKIYGQVERGEIDLFKEA